MLNKAVVFIYIFLQTFFVFSQNTLVKSTDYDNYRTGLELLDKKKYGAARETFEQFINSNHTDLRAIDAEYYIAYSALNLFNPDAEKLFENFIEKYPYHTKAEAAYYELGSFYYNNKKYEKAIEYLEKVNPAHLSDAQQVEAKFRLAYSYFSQKDFDKAGKLFNEIKNSDHKYTYASNYYAAYIEYRNDEYDAALEDLKKAEKSDIYKSMVPVLVINVYYKQSKYNDLLNYAEEVLKRGDKLQGADEIFLLSAEANFMQKNYAKSAEYFKKYMSESKAKLSPEVQYRLAFSEYKAGSYESAVKDFKTIASPKDSLGNSALYYLGLSYLKTNNKPYALTAFDQSRKASFNKEMQEEALFNYGKINYDLEKFHESISPLKDFIKQYPKSEHITEVQDLLSEAFLRTNNYSEAITYIEGLKNRSTRVNTAFQTITYNKGIELFNNNKFAEAILMFDKSLQNPITDEVTVGSYFWKGEAYSVLKDYENAIKNYSPVLQKAANTNSEYYLKARYGIGYAYYNSKQYEKALPYFKEYVSQLAGASNKQNYQDAVLRLADLYYVTKKYDEAVKYYNLAIDQKNVDMDYAYFQKGIVLGLDNKLTDAKSSFDQVIKNYPSSLYYDDAVFQKAQLDLESSNYEAAVSGFTVIIDTKPNSGFVPYSILKRAISYSNLKKYTEAISDYKLLLNKYAAHPVAHNALLGLQESLAAAGRSEELNEILAKYKEINPQSDALVNVEFENAKSLYNDQKYKQAIESFNAYIKNYPASPNNAEINFYLAESNYRLKEYDNALTLFKTVIENKGISSYNRSVQRIAEIEYLRKSYTNSKNYYNLLLVNAKNKKERFTAWIGLMETNYKLSNPDSVIFFTKEILNHGNASIDAENKALLYSGKVASDKKEYDKATDFFINTLNTAKDENGAEAQFLIADIQNKQEKYKQSIETLYDLNNNFAEYQDWLGKSYLLIAENFVSLNEIFQAKATLNSIIEKSPDKVLVEKAKNRIEEMDKKEKEQ